MNGRNARRRRVGFSLAALGVMAGLPALAFALAPSPAAHADDTPGANLAGLNATSSAYGVQVAPLIPGVVPAGNVTQGSFVEADIPYATATTATGPSSSSLGSPAYPGDTAAGAGNALGTFAPQFPPALLNALNDPVLARADYPAQVSVGSSSTYAPPGLSGTGIGTASADASPSGSDAKSATSSTSLATALTVASSTVSSATELTASTVAAAAHTEIGSIDIMSGMVHIAGLTSDATASSDGNLGQPTSDFKLGAVTVAGTPASIGPNGITVGPSSQGGVLAPTANQILAALKQAGISVHTIVPVTTVDGASATVSSGALVINFQDPNIPNPNGQVPVSSVGINLNLGLSQASANATALPPFASFPSDVFGTPAASPASSGPGGNGSTDLSGGALPVSSGGQAVTAAPSQGGPSTATPASGQPSGSAGSSGGPLVPIPPTNLLGAPIKVAWVVIAFLLSLVVAGPLLGYANWQLLRGRKS